jgi:hypothetical protein
MQPLLQYRIAPAMSAIERNFVARIPTIVEPAFY